VLDQPVPGLDGQDRLAGAAVGHGGHADRGGRVGVVGVLVDDLEQHAGGVSIGRGIVALGRLLEAVGRRAELLADARDLDLLDDLPAGIAGLEALAALGGLAQLVDPLAVPGVARQGVEDLPGLDGEVGVRRDAAVLVEQHLVHRLRLVPVGEEEHLGGDAATVAERRRVVGIALAPADHRRLPLRDQRGNRHGVGNAPQVVPRAFLVGRRLVGN